MATFKLLDSYTVGSGGVSSVTFSSIPQTYTDLKLVMSARGTQAAIQSTYNISFNGSSANQSAYRLYGDGTGNNASTDTTLNLEAVGANATGSIFNNYDLYIPNYTSTTIPKVMSSDGVLENNASQTYDILTAGLWNPGTQAAISSITLTPSGGNTFVQYSTFYLYGVWADTSTNKPSAPTIGTATATSGTTATVAFTPAGSGSTSVYYQALSTPGSITATGTSSPITVTGLTPDTSYTFQVAGVNPIGTGTYSSASNSVTPAYTAVYESISTATVGAGGASSVTFSNIPQTYKHLQIRAVARTDRGNTYDDIRAYINGNTTSSYYFHMLYGISGTIYSGGGTNVSMLAWGSGMAGGGAGSSTFSSAVIDVLDYSDTNKIKTFKSISGLNTNGGGLVSFTSHLFPSTSAITSIQLFGIGTMQQYSHFALYGIKGS